MAQIGGPGGGPGHDAVPIGEVSAPPFARAPDPAMLFRGRAARFRQAAAEGHALAPYLEFLAGIAEAQDGVQADLPAPEPLDSGALARAREFGMPALDRASLASQPACAAAVGRVLAAVAPLDMPEAARAALDAVSARGEDERAAMARNVLDEAIPFDRLAEHLFVAAGLQVHAARAAASLDAAALVPVGDGVCPACGGAPVASLIVGWRGAHGARFCACSLCGTLWNHVRIRCTACGSGEGISYQEQEGADGTVKAECCGECRTYLKIMNQTKDPALDPVADDVATSALDLLVKESGVRRSGVNPFLLGY